MQTTRVFKSGNSQAVRLPKNFQLDCEEVEILRRNEEIIIRKIPRNLAAAFYSFATFPDDFFAEERNDPPPQERDINF